MSHNKLRILEAKLLHNGLIQVEMGDQGNCIFHVISHQLFNDPTHHLYVRAARVNYLEKTQKGSLKVILTSHGLTTWKTCLNKEHGLII